MAYASFYTPTLLFLVCKYMKFLRIKVTLAVTRLTCFFTHVCMLLVTITIYNRNFYDEKTLYLTPINFSLFLWF